MTRIRLSTIAGKMSSVQKSHLLLEYKPINTIRRVEPLIIKLIWLASMNSKFSLSLMGLPSKFTKRGSTNFLTMNRTILKRTRVTFIAINM